MLKNLKRILCIAIIVLLSTFTTFTAFAEEFVENETEYIIPEEQEVITTAYQEYTQAPEPVTEAPIYTQAPEPVTEAPVYTQAPQEQFTEYYTQAPEPVTEVMTEAQQEYVQEYVQDPVEPNYNFYEEPTEFQNQQEYYEVESTEPTEQITSLYQDVEEIDDTELKKKNWENISSKLANAKENNKNSKASPFDYIKNNEKATGFQAFLNSLNWALTAGIVCFILAIACIVLFIVLTKKNKRNMNNKDKNDDDKPTPIKKNGKTDENGYYVPPSKRAKSDYGDDYSSDLSKYDELIEPRKAVKKKKVSQDTGEVVIPKNYRN